MSAADLLQRLNIDLVSALDETERRQVLQACDRLKAKLETPMDTTARLVFSVCRRETGRRMAATVLTEYIESPSHGSEVGDRYEAFRCHGPSKQVSRGILPSTGLV